MPRKMARSGCPTAVRARRMAIAVGTARQLCGRAGKPPVFTPTRVSSGESRLESDQHALRNPVGWQSRGLFINAFALS
jgi:hypothetical protein